MPYFVYITTNANRTVLYTGVTSQLAKRMEQHKALAGTPKSFAGKYFAYNLLHIEQYDQVSDAIAREKEIKGWRRAKKVELIERHNPRWAFLTPTK